jgi:hypothetical protein
MAFAVVSDCKLSDLRKITDGSGYDASGSTSETKLRANCANSSSATNVKMTVSFWPGTRTLTIAGPGRVNDAFFVLPHSSTSTLTGTLTWSGGGTYFASRCLNQNSSNLGSKWQLNNSGTSTASASLSGNDSISWSNGNGTATSQSFSVTPGSPAGTDFMEMMQVVEANNCWERFYCNTSGGSAAGNVHVTSESNANGTLTVYDQDGGGF